MNNQELLHYFESYLRHERHYSELTVKAYLTDCQEFEHFLKETGSSDLLQVSLADARVYMGHLTDRGLSRNSMARKVSSLRAFYHFLLQNKEIGDNPFSHLNLRKSGLSLPTFFYSEEMEALFEAAQGDEVLDLRNMALLELMYATGIRVSECTQIRLQDVNFDLSLVFIRGKGNKERYVPYGDYADQAIRDYLPARQDLMDHHQRDHDVLLVNHHGDPLTASGVDYILKQIIKKTNLTTGISPHKIRHSFATHLLNNGADIRSVQELLGHSSLSSTQIYTHITKEHLQDEYNKYFSRS